MLKGNNLGTVIAIDNWNPNFLLYNNQNNSQLIKNSFISNSQFYSEYAQEFDYIDMDCWSVDIQILKKQYGVTFDIYFYDGPHETLDHYLAIVNYFPILSDIFILIVDDYNIDEVKAGTSFALKSLPIKILSKYEISTIINPGYKKSLWHNGLAIFIIEKLK